MLESSKRLVVIGLRLRHPNYLKKWWLNVNGKPNILWTSNSKLLFVVPGIALVPLFFIFRLSIPRQIWSTFKIRCILSGHISSLNQFQFTVKNQCNFFLSRNQIEYSPFCNKTLYGLLLDWTGISATSFIRKTIFSSYGNQFGKVYAFVVNLSGWKHGGSEIFLRISSCISEKIWGNFPLVQLRLKLDSCMAS